MITWIYSSQSIYRIHTEIYQYILEQSNLLQPKYTPEVTGTSHDIEEKPDEPEAIDKLSSIAFYQGCAISLLAQVFNALSILTSQVNFPTIIQSLFR